MQVEFSNKAKRQLEFLSAKRDKKTLKKFYDLITSIQDTPFTGLGKPEALKHELKGYWSRRINTKDRLVYKIEDEKIRIYSLIGHYEK